MSKAAGKAAPSKGAAARTKSEAAMAEQNGHIDADFRGVSLTLQTVMPIHAAMRMRSMRRAGEDTPMTAVFDLLEDVLNREQYAQVTNRIAVLSESEDDGALLTELAQTVLGAYGMELGESSASAKS